MRKYLMIGLWLFSSGPIWAETDIMAVGLFKNQAMLEINGQQRLLKVGKRSPEGVKLISATAKLAVIEFEGKQIELKLNRRISGQYSKPTFPEVSISMNNAQQYVTGGAINGRPVTFLVDTGANIIALNSLQASAVGIDYRGGRKGYTETASGRVISYNVKLNSVKVGAIEVKNVVATVLEGEFPSRILLGMTFLREVEYSVVNGIMTIKQRY